ncbi:MAG: hypothetical protein ACOYNY_05090 [Caldilineaceae bacterium]|jgi:hypothetical protein
MSEFPEIDLYTEVDDELYEELAALAGEKIVHVEIWEESLGDVMAGEEGEETGQIGFDIDLYLEGGIYFELYSTVCYPTIESDPLEGLSTVQNSLSSLVKSGVWLEEVAVDDENSLILVLAQQKKPRLYLLIGAWTVGEWDELPEG